jgi:DNA repair protein RadC
MEEELGVVEAIRDTVLREVRVNYIPTITAKFLVRQPSSVAEFVRSILTDNSREHFVAVLRRQSCSSRILHCCDR